MTHDLMPRGRRPLILPGHTLSRILCGRWLRGRSHSQEPSTSSSRPSPPEIWPFPATWAGSEPVLSRCLHLDVPASTLHPPVAMKSFHDSPPGPAGWIDSQPWAIAKRRWGIQANALSMDARLRRPPGNGPEVSPRQQLVSVVIALLTFALLVFPAAGQQLEAGVGYQEQMGDGGPHMILGISGLLGHLTVVRGTTQLRDMDMDGSRESGTFYAGSWVILPTVGIERVTWGDRWVRTDFRVGGIVRLGSPERTSRGMVSAGLGIEEVRRRSEVLRADVTRPWYKARASLTSRRSGLSVSGLIRQSGNRFLNHTWGLDLTWKL